MLIWALAVIVLVLTWGSVLLLRVMEVDVPMSIPLIVTVVTVAAVLGWIAWRKARALARAKELEREILRQSEQQAAMARPDRRAEINELQKQVLAGISALKNTKVGKRHGARALYALPWYVIIGPPGAGKTTALKQSGLVFPHLDPSRGGVRGIGGTRNCDWWFTNEGILLDTAGRYATEEDDREEWFSFLTMLRKHRPQKPLNGLLVAVAVSDLVEATEDQIAAQAANLRSRVDEIMTRLDMVLPVYLVFTKADLIGGFTEFYGELRKSERDQILGATFALDGTDQKDAGEAFRETFKNLVSVAHARALRTIGRERRVEMRGRIYEFPLELGALGHNLEHFVRALFQRNTFQENPLFRGYYLTSGTQEGRPFARVIGGMARAFGIRAPDFHQAPTEAKSYFVTDVFRQVVFPDQDIAGRTASELRRQKLTRALIAGAAALVGLGLVIPAIASYVKNQKLLTAARSVAGEARAVVWAEPGQQLQKVQALDPTRDLLLRLDGWAEDGPPLSMRWGMYAGEPVRGALLTAYVRNLRVGLEKPSQTELEGKLRALGELRELPNAQYAGQYNSLKLYLMLSEPARLDVEWAVEPLRNLWAQALRTQDPKVLEAMEPHAEYYLALMKRGDIPPWPGEPQLVSRSRTVLLRAPQVDRMYEILVREANARVAPIRRESIFYGSVAPYVSGKEDVVVPGAYTREGWSHVRTFLGAKRSQLSDDGWVLGEKVEQSAAESAKQIERLKEMYFGRYKKAWRDFFLDLRVERPENSEKALDELNALSEPEWPYLRLIRTLNENVSLDVEETEEIGVKEKLIQAAKKEVEKRVGEKGEEPETPERRVSEVERAFRPLIDFAVAPPGSSSPTGLTEYQGIIAKLVGVLTDRRDSDASPKTKDAAADFQQAYRSTSGLLSSQDGYTRPMLEPLLMRPIAGAWTGVVNDAGGAASGLWEVTVWDKWRTTLQPHYPFSATGNDAKLSDFSEFFAPKTGLLWGFYEANLSGSLQRVGNTFSPARRFDAGVSFDGTFLSECLGRSAMLTDEFFPEEASQPRLAFEVNLHSVSPNVSEIRLAIDGVEHVYKNTPEEWIAATWPAEDAKAPGARVRIRGRNALDEEIIRDGDFGFFRLLDAAHSIVLDPDAPRDGRTLVATWELPSERTFFRLHVRTKRGPLPLAREVFRKVACPRVISRPDR